MVINENPIIKVGSNEKCMDWKKILLKKCVVSFLKNSTFCLLCLERIGKTYFIIQKLAKVPVKKRANNWPIIK